MHQGCLVTECHILGAVHLTSSIVVLTLPLYWWHGLLKVYKLALSEVETSASKSLFLKLVFFCGVKILNKLWHKSWAAHAAWVSTQPECPHSLGVHPWWLEKSCGCGQFHLTRWLFPFVSYSVGSCRTLCWASWDVSYIPIGRHHFIIDWHQRRYQGPWAIFSQPQHHSYENKKGICS